MLPDSIHRRIPGLDLLRAFAIISVVLFHYGLRDGAFRIAFFHDFGWTGVDLFFVLSGYLIGGQLFGALKASGSVSLARFYLRRAFRILPAYWVVLALYAAWPGFREDPDLAPLWRFITFTHNLDLSRAIYRTFSQSWSLCVEEHFYLFFPLLTAWVASSRRSSRNAIALCISVFLTGLALRYWMFSLKVSPLLESGVGVGQAYQRWIYYPTYTRLDGLLGGVCLALIQRYCPLIWSKWVSIRWRLAIVGLTSLAVAYFMEAHALATALFVYPLVSLGYALTFPAAVSARWIAKVPGFRFVAEHAFALYLTHKQVFHLVHEALVARAIMAPPLAELLVALACAMTAAWLLHRLVERPFLALRDRWTIRSRESRATLAPVRDCVSE
jgi:peptidoglycan/LPS O-acetylase OafA/YrhL